MMESIVLDTNVLSELMHRTPEQTVMEWFANRTSVVFYVTAITQAEIMLGITLLPAGKRREALYSAASMMFSQDFYGRCLSFDETAVSHYATIVSKRRRSGHAISTEDAMIASIALAYGYPLATRNTKDFMFIDGLSLYNPWQM